MKETPGNIAACAEELDRLMKSGTFRASESLRRLLLYLGNKSISGEAEDLKEYTVGVEAFGKSSDYDPQLDASVRIQAGKLRKKLEDYFRTEGLQDQVVVSFPKGHFRLEFELRSKPEEHQRLQSGLRKWRIATGALAGGFLLCCSFIAYLLLTSSPADTADRNNRWTAELHAIWDPLLRTRNRF